MKRMGFVLGIKADQIAEYKRIHAAVWPEVLATIARCNIKNYTIFLKEPENLLFALKDAVASGGSLAMQCDRMEFTSKTESFQFLGARRAFPFTIYHLGLLFDRPVLFCVGLPSARHDSMVLHASPAFRRDPRLSRAANLERAREHFQGVLSQLESLVRQHPSLWFNFLPLNPVTTSRPSP